MLPAPASTQCWRYRLWRWGWGAASRWRSCPRSSRFFWLPIVPSIAVGNLVFVALLGLLAGGRDLPLWRSAGAVLAAAVCKFGALYLLVVKLLCTVLPLKEPQIAAFTVMFSYPQLVTALAGGTVGLLLAPVLRRALKR